MREAKMPWTVGGMWTSVSGLVNLVAPVWTTHPARPAHAIFLDEEGITSGFLDDQSFEEDLQASRHRRAARVAASRRRYLTPQRIEAQLGVTGAVAASDGIRAGS